MDENNALLEEIAWLKFNRRGQIAIALAAGMYANPSTDWTRIPHDAVHEADALIAELDKTHEH